jgi:ribosomal protein S26
MISDRVKEEEHNAGKVRCVECGGVIPDPHL